MSKKALVRLLKYGLSTAAGILVAFLYINSYDLTDAARTDVYMCLSNAFFLPGAMMILFGLFIFVANEGIFNGVGYVLHVVVHTILPGGRYTMEKYGDYLERKRETKTLGYGFLFVVGGVFAAVGVLFAVLFYYA